MRYAPRALLAGGLGFAVSFLVACGGGSGLLSADQASNLNGQLDQVSSAVSNGQCGAAANAITTFSNAIVNLPPSVSPTLTRTLEQGAATVAQLAARDCQNPSTTSTTSSTTSSSTTTTSSPTTNTSTSVTTSTNPTTSTAPTTSTTATTQTSSGTTSTTSGSGGSGLPGSGGTGVGAANGGNRGTGGSGTGGNGNGQ